MPRSAFIPSALDSLGWYARCAPLLYALGFVVPLILVERHFLRTVHDSPGGFLSAALILVTGLQAIRLHGSLRDVGGLPDLPSDNPAIRSATRFCRSITLARFGALFAALMPIDPGLALLVFGALYALDMSVDADADSWPISEDNRRRAIRLPAEDTPL